NIERMINDQLAVILKDPQGSLSNAIGEIAKHKVFNSEAFVRSVQIPLDRLSRASEKDDAWRAELDRRVDKLEDSHTRLDMGMQSVNKAISELRNDLKELQGELQERYDMLLRAMQESERRIIEALARH